MEKNTLQNSLNELSKGTTNDVDSIMIRDAAGNQYWIAKADLASVLGELLKPFRPLDDEITDLDNVKGSGWKVLVIDKVINMPSGFPEEKYCIFEQIYATVSSIKQTITFNDSKRIVTRNSTGAKFGEWREISLK